MDGYTVLGTFVYWYWMQVTRIGRMLLVAYGLDGSETEYYTKGSSFTSPSSRSIAVKDVPICAPYTKCIWTGSNGATDTLAATANAGYNVRIDTFNFVAKWLVEDKA